MRRKLEKTTAALIAGGQEENAGNAKKEGGLDYDGRGKNFEKAEEDVRHKCHRT